MNNDYNKFGDNGENEEMTSSADEGVKNVSTEGPVPEKRSETSGNGEWKQTGEEFGEYRRETPYYSNRQNTEDGMRGGSYTYRGEYSYNERPESRHTYYGGYGEKDPYAAPEKKVKNKKGVSGALLAVICVFAIVFSAAAGIGGAYLYDNVISGRENSVNNGDGESEKTPAGDDKTSSLLGDASDVTADTQNGGTTVIHRVVETDESTSAGVKGIYTDVAAIVKDSVVEITTEFKVEGFFQYVSEGAGSGVIISEEGFIITNNHVIADTKDDGVADTITVRLTNGNEYKAKVIGRDADSDIAVIKIEPDEKLSYAVFGDSDKLTVGEEVLAVGNPLGELGGTVTNGIISALDREISVDGTKMNLLQTNAAINPGNSGGGLFNMKGELVGVVNAKSSGSGIEGLGFAIPANDAYNVAEELIEHGYVTGKTYIGVSFYDVTDTYTAYRYFGSQSTGVYVVETLEGYNDDVLEYGDRIVDVDGNEISEFAQIKDILNEHEVGDVLEFTLYRKGKLTKVEVTLFEYVPENVDKIDFDK